MVPIGYAAQRLPWLQQAVVNRSQMLPDGGHGSNLNVAPTYRAWPELSEESAIAGLEASATLKLGHDQTAGTAWKKGSTRMILLFGKEGPEVVDRQVTTAPWPLLRRRRGVYVRGGRKQPNGARVRGPLASFLRADSLYVPREPEGEEHLQACGLAPSARVARATAAVPRLASSPAVFQDCGWREASPPWTDVRCRRRGLSVQAERCLAAYESGHAASYPGCQPVLRRCPHGNRPAARRPLQTACRG
jgi:hypothetical protein